MNMWSMDEACCVWIGQSDCLTVGGHVAGNVSSEDGII